MALSYFFWKKNDFPRTGDNVWLANFSITYFCQPCHISRCPDKSKNKIQHKRWTNLHVWGDFKRLSDAESSLGSKGRMKISCLQEKAPPVSVCMKQWLCNSMLTIWSQSCGAVIMNQKGNKKDNQTFTIPGRGLISASFIQCAWWQRWRWWQGEAWRCVCATPHWLEPALTALWAWCLIIHVVGGGETDILFSSYLGIYCSTECNITVQKQDPKRTNPTIPPFSSAPPPHFSLLPKLHYSTANSSNLLQSPDPFRLITNSITWRRIITVGASVCFWNVPKIITNVPQVISECSFPHILCFIMFLFCFFYIFAK